VNDLMAIRGIGPKRLEKMKMYLTVGKPKSANPAVAAKCSGCSTQKIACACKIRGGPENSIDSNFSRVAAAATEEP